MSYSQKMDERVDRVCKALGYWECNFEVLLILSSKKGFLESQGFKNTLTESSGNTLRDWKRILRKQNSCSAEFELCIREIDKLLRIQVPKLRVIVNTAPEQVSRLAAHA